MLSPIRSAVIQTNPDRFKNFEATQDNGEGGGLEKGGDDEWRILEVIRKVELPRHQHHFGESQSVDQGESMKGKRNVMLG